MSVGRIVGVYKNRLACAVTITLAGDNTTTLVHVDMHVVDFDEDGGRFRHEPTGDIYDYASVDYDAETITLSAGLPVGKTLTADDALQVVDADGNRVDDFYADVAIDDVAVDVVSARVPQTLRTLLVEGAASKGKIVRVMAGGEEWHVTEMVGQELSAGESGVFTTGDIKATAIDVTGNGAVIDGGWLKCDGTAVLRSAFPALHAAAKAVGYASPWGSGNGSTTFNIPDLRGRTLFGVGTVVSLGQNDGKVQANRGPGHEHAITQTAADVAVNTQTTPGGANRVTGGGASPWVHDHGGATGSGLGSTNALGYMGINYLVKT